MVTSSGRRISTPAADCVRLSEDFVHLSASDSQTQAVTLCLRQSGSQSDFVTGSSILTPYHVDAPGPPALPTSLRMCIVRVGSVQVQLYFTGKVCDALTELRRYNEGFCTLKTTGHGTSLIRSPTHRDVDAKTAFCQFTGCSRWQRRKRNMCPCCFRGL